MEFGIAIATSADSWKLALRAEELGFARAWFYDTQMLSADPFVAMGATAVKTRRIRLGLGVLVPSNRIAPVTANALASLNKLAPGRIDFGIGTGFTARRSMGLGAIRLAEMRQYTDTVTALLREEAVESEFEGKLRNIRFLNPELGLINTRDLIALHISAYGPRSRAVTAELGAGWLNFIGDIAGAVAAARDMQHHWQEAGRDPAALEATAFALGCVLAEGEPADSPRAIAEAGPRAATLLHRAAYAALAGLPNTSPIPPAFAETVGAYVETARRFAPADAHYLVNHRGHLMFVRPDERPFITAELVAATTLTATEKVLVERITALADAGYTELAIQIVPGRDAAIEDWARLKRAFA